jgi:NAD-dependent SIR2 family protein deacetylase
MEQNDLVLDVHGNNAAVKCPHCCRVFVVSKFLDRVRGRKCPECGECTFAFQGSKVVAVAK